MILSSRGTALITGASSGIGAVYAERLAERGHDLIVVARDRDRLRTLASEISDNTGRSVEVLTADLGDSDGVRTVEQVLANDASISMLVNNAGVGATAPLLASDVDTMEALINLDVIALMRLTYAAAPRFVARGHGAIVNISSIVAIGPELMNGVYGGAKSFVLAFSRSLHHELAEKGVRVQAVLPGATGFRDVAGSSAPRLPAGIVMPATALVDAALAGLDSGELVTIPSLPDADQWHAYETARQAMLPNLLLAEPAGRYL